MQLLELIRGSIACLELTRPKAKFVLELVEFCLYSPSIFQETALIAYPENTIAWECITVGICNMGPWQPHFRPTEGRRTALTLLFTAPPPFSSPSHVVTSTS